MNKRLTPGRIELLFVTIFLIIFSYQAVRGIYVNSITFDEPAFLAGGMNILRNSDYRFNPEAVVMSQFLEALPASVASGVSFPPLGSRNTLEQWSFAEEYICKSGNDSDFILHSGRFMVLVIALLVGSAVYLWSRRLWGMRGGLLSLFLFAFSPALIAHSGIAASDMITSFFFLASLWAVWRMMIKATVISVLSSSVFLGFLFLSKYSSFCFIFVFMIIMAVRSFSAKPLVINIFKFRKVIVDKYIKLISFICFGIVNAMIIFAMIWTFYSFRHSMDNPESPMENKALIWAALPDDSPVVKIIKFADSKHILPEAYLYGFAYTYTQAASRNAFLNGAYSNDGWWYFFPYAFLVKTSPGLLVILAVSIFIFIKRKNLFYKISPFLIFIAVYMFFAITGKMNIGHRHILPIYPMLFIIAGTAAVYFKRGFLIAAPVLLACFWTLSAAFSVSPYYLAYFNFIAGGPSNGYKHLVDSSLDWGQGVSVLKTYLAEDAPSGKPVYFSQFGSISYQNNGLDAFDMISYFPQPKGIIVNFHGGLYCISATLYQLVHYPELASWSHETERYYKNISGKISRYLPLIDAGDIGKSFADKKVSDAFRFYSPYKILAGAKIILYLHEMKKEPIAMPGYSMLVFDLSENEVRDALSLPSVPIRHQ